MMRSVAALSLALVLRAAAQPADGTPESLRAALEAVRADEAQRVAILERAATSVVCIYADPARSGGGSGVIIHPDGYGLTNFHVVQSFLDSRRGYGGLADGRLYPLRVLGVDAGGDVAMFKLEGRARFDFAPLGDSDTLRVGQPVAAIGNPFLLAEDYAATITLGVISGLHRYQEGQQNLLEYADCIQVSTSINPGNSGGPLFAMSGEVAGINGRISGEERARVNVGLGYAISINQIKRFLPGLRAGRWCEHGTLGATVRGLRDGVIIDALQALSPAERAGLALRDRIVSVAGRTIRTPNEYNNILATLPADWPVRIEYEREGRLATADARLERILLRVESPWLVDRAHNHAELRAILERGAAQIGLRAAAPGATIEWSGLTRRDRAAPTEFSFPASATAASGPASTSTPAPGDAWQREWEWLVAPLLHVPALDATWELLAGDEVRERVCSVVERRIDAAVRVRWAFDFETGELLRVWIGNDENPRGIAWEPHEVAELGAFRFPRRWVRSHEGTELVVELSAARRAPAEGDAP